MTRQLGSYGRGVGQTAAFRDICGTLFPSNDARIAGSNNCKLLKQIRMAVDRVQSEPLSSEFPLTGNNTEKFTAFAP
jgi:hypothetical protein